MSPPRIGIVGAYGDVGRALARKVSARKDVLLRLGGRSLARARTLAAELGEGTEAQAVDASDPQSLLSFCRDCEVVVNCAGPSRQVLDAVACAAVNVRAHYVDVAGDEPVHERATRFRMHASAPRSVVLSAGMLPGLSTLLPSYLCRDGAQPVTQTAYFAVLDRLSASAAEDYLSGLFESESLACWHAGSRAVKRLRRQSDVELPFFPHAVTAHPFLSPEGERLAKRLQLEKAAWYNVFDGRHLLSALERVAAQKISGEALRAGACELQRAAELDVAGRTPYVRFTFEVEVRDGDRTQVRSLVLEASSAAALSATFGACAVSAALAGSLPNDACYAADVLDADQVVRALCEDASVRRLDSFDEALASAARVEQGAL